jgi:hypothetical protein
VLTAMNDSSHQQ